MTVPAAGEPAEQRAVEVPGALAGERVDKVVALITDCSRAEAARLVAAGAVRVAGTTVGVASRRLRTGELLEVALLAPEPEPVPAEEVAQLPPLAVVHADDDLIVVDKPAGVVVHAGAGHVHDTLVTQLLAAFPDLGTTTGIGEAARPGIVHRLDKETSGLLVVARSARAFESLTAQLASREMGRTYRVLVLGSIGDELGVVDAPIGRSRRDPTRMAVVSGGRAARTGYKVLNRYREPLAASELEVRLETGRTHQIRVHLSAIGHPVAGDARYGGGRKASGLKRPFLHAAELALIHPANGEQGQFRSPLPEDLQAALRHFR